MNPARISENTAKDPWYARSATAPEGILVHTEQYDSRRKADTNESTSIINRFEGVNEIMELPPPDPTVSA